ncbi:MAG: hypothetical protein ABJB66_05655 [Gemmatimonadaceae bacterium]
MAQPTDKNISDKLSNYTPDVERANELLSTHLHSRNVLVHSSDNSDELASMMEAVEAFEAAVEARGGDLMIDEAPEGKKGEPDNPSFVLPKRSSNETASAYIGRIRTATQAVRD